jgi:transcriptional regulator with GAF, ATPase, and Fis domain
VADDEGVLAGARQALVESGMLALLSIPLQAADRVVGSVIVQRATPGPFSDVSMRLYETLADQAAVALERAQLVEESQRRAASERLTAEIGARMRETLDIETILKVTAQEIRQALALPEVIVRLEPPPPGSGDKDEGPSDS